MLHRYSMTGDPIGYKDESSFVGKTLRKPRSDKGKTHRKSGGVIGFFKGLVGRRKKS